MSKLASYSAHRQKDDKSRFIKKNTQKLIRELDKEISRLSVDEKRFELSRNKTQKLSITEIP